MNSRTARLRLAPIDVVNMGRDLVATCYMNWASLFQECVRDFNRAHQICPRTTSQGSLTLGGIKRTDPFSCSASELTRDSWSRTDTDRRRFGNRLCLSLIFS
ncbi:uncharacterized protein LOC120016529 isoform X2 [Tripterygium wilfordii]|uniref:uncharacterized protein LOC120016529 isoform X2 n=1 Tax=Tripterygium wilfordii TaxID=458696 RepID=UPI0018F814CF|nr:uncharacterized protein LOC120016529 isoform X2 [Tripterygium wilfordii]XP_038725274.1 uncharacterized protein LOC120016529 isoform X2 [Tripterygium wilfordii]XP_038725275.1 uncharacterized protein LOC120016529 isoform X2 [Tripterygium wilfordii]XP_038725276.1 uncharacterized protein LOC120016529 isoform X2 [Tripterygium wilfordii]XP_038725277.1 uncharacterized protein LOC120016529 isoform X2 [Tripterygium wilfordii]XP_038725279.1 uncharacterized protein LOC120016529 isoform X2 [Tripterygiu